MVGARANATAAQLDAHDTQLKFLKVRGLFCLLLQLPLTVYGHSVDQYFLIWFFILFVKTAVKSVESDAAKGRDNIKV